MWLAQHPSADWLIQTLAMTQNGLVPVCVSEKISVLGWQWASENPTRGEVYSLKPQNCSHLPDCTKLWPDFRSFSLGERKHEH